MNHSKRLAKKLMEALGRENLGNKKAAEHLRWLADECENYGESIFEIGVEEIIKECKKFYRRVENKKAEIYSDGDHFEPLTDIENAISLLSGLMLDAQYLGSDIQRFINAFYEKFKVPGNRRTLLKKGRVKVKRVIAINFMMELEEVELTKKSLKHNIRAKADQCKDFKSNIFEIGVKKIVKEYEKLSCEEEYLNPINNDYPLHYHEIEDEEELKVLEGLTLVSRTRDKFGDDGDGMDFTFKETDEGVRMINFFVIDNGGMYLSDWY